MERGYSERMVRTQIHRARGKSRDAFFEGKNARASDSNLHFNITYYPVFQNVRSILKKLHILLAPDREHTKVFPEVKIAGFQNGKSITDYLVRAALPKINHAGGNETCEKSAYQVCDHVITIKNFATNACEKVFKIPRRHLDCNSEKFLYLLICKICHDTPILEKLKQNFAFDLTIIKVNTDLFKEGNRT